MEDLNSAIERCKGKMERILRSEVILKEPSVSIIHCPVEYLREIYKKYVLILKDLKQKYSKWNYGIINLEKELFNLLRDLDYISNEKIAETCKRKDLEINFRGYIIEGLVQEIENCIKSLLESHQQNDPPPFLIIQNIHSCYKHIQTKDIITRIRNQKDVLILILYLQRDKSMPYKSSDYNVNTYFLMR